MTRGPMTIADRLSHLRQGIRAAAAQVHRDPASIAVIGVAKGVSPTDLKLAQAAGLDDMGENYLQEAEDHLAALSTLPVTWHYIGAIQSNKTRAIATHFAWVHTLDRGKIAERLAAQRPASAPPLNVLIQVNFDNAASKAGVSEDQLPILGAQILTLPRLCWRGLMALPEPRSNADEQQACFAKVRDSLAHLRRTFPNAPLDSLSMGMSNDYPAAIMAGATHIRIGTALFGARTFARAPTGPSRSPQGAAQQ